MVIVKSQAAPVSTELSQEKESLPTPLPVLSESEKIKALKEAEKRLCKDYGCQIVQRLGDRVGQRPACLSTGLVSVDEGILLCGGLPKGRIVEIFGPECSGKTTFALQVIAETQRAGGLAAFIDAEHALDVNRAVQLGVNMDELRISQPDYGEQALEVTLELVKTRALAIVVIDSVSALVPKAELDGEMGQAHMGLQARLMSQAMRKLCGEVAKSQCVLIFINQIREKVGVMFGNPEVTSGGRALKFYASVRLEVRRVSNTDGGTLKDGEIQIGHKIRVKAVKNKVAAPFREGVITLYYDERGFDVKGDLVDFAVDRGVIEKAGSWYVFDDQKFRKKDLTEDPLFGTLRMAIEKILSLSSHI